MRRVPIKQVEEVFLLFTFLWDYQMFLGSLSTSRIKEAFSTLSFRRETVLRNVGRTCSTSWDVPCRHFVCSYLQYKAQTERAVCDRTLWHKNFRNTLTNITDSSRTEARHTYSNLKSVWVIFRSVSSFEHDPVLQLPERLQHENWCCVSMWWIHIDSASDVFVFLCDGSSSAEWRRSFVRTKCPSVPTTPLAASLSTAPGAAVHLQRWRTRAHILKPRALHTKKHITRSAGHRLMLPAQHICILHVMKLHHK